MAPSGAPSIQSGELTFAGPNFTGWLVAADGSDLRPVTLPDTTAYIVPWVYSPDGTRIATPGTSPYKTHGGAHFRSERRQPRRVTASTEQHGSETRVSVGA